VLPCILVALFFVVKKNIAYTPTPLYLPHFEAPLMTAYDLKIKVIPTKFSYKIRDLEEKKKLIN
jgi:hypothetical protein